MLACRLDKEGWRGKETGGRREGDGEGRSVLNAVTWGLG